MPSQPKIDEKNNNNDDDETRLARTYVLKPSALKESKSLEELAELAAESKGPEIPEDTATEPDDDPPPD